METNRLRQFCVIAETGSLTKASELLHITHSGLSKSMKLLQEEIGYTLFRPSGRGLEITEEGFKVYKKAKEFLKQEELFFKQDEKPAQAALKVAALEIFHSGFTNQLAHSSLVNRNIILIDLDPGKIEQAIAQKEIDFGVTCVPCPLENVAIAEIGKFALGCYHLQGCFTDIPFSEIPFVVPARDFLCNPFFGIYEGDAWNKNNLTRHKKYTANLFYTALEMTLQGLCAIYIPRYIANMINASRRPKQKLVEFNLSEQNNLRAFLLWHKDNADAAVIAEIKQMIFRLIER